MLLVNIMYKLLFRITAVNSDLTTVTSQSVINGITLYKLGKINILSCMNGSATLTTDGIYLDGKSVLTTCYAKCTYYDGSNNVEGYLRAEGNYIFLCNKSLTITSGSYITGSIVFVTT